MKREMIIAGNWKSNGTLALRAEINNLLNDTNIEQGIAVVVCPPVTLLEGMISDNKNPSISFGGQNLAEYGQGAYTGEVHAQMLRDIGANYVIIGHSERREYFSEKAEILAIKMLKAIDAGLKPIFCIGEPESIRENGEQNQYIESQIEEIIAITGIDVWAESILAYEPIWAIGTGKTASLDQVQEMHAHIRDTFSKHSDTIAALLPILYGGSVNQNNAAQLFTAVDVDGALIGGASLKQDQFAAIISAANAEANSN